MLLQTKFEILNWLKTNDWYYNHNVYDFIDIHDIKNQSLLKEIIKKDNLSFNYFEALKYDFHRFIINVDGHVNISNHQLIDIPFQFYHIKGEFNCSVNQIISLRGFPQKIDGNSDCDINCITSLKFCPQYVGRNFSCANNQLESLEYFPEIVQGKVHLEFNKELLKYKNTSHEVFLNNMSSRDFFYQDDFIFWQKFHLEEKAKKEEEYITNQLLKSEQLNCNIKQKIKKV